MVKLIEVLGEPTASSSSGVTRKETPILLEASTVVL
jgi:hypothetical protein